MSDFLDFYFYWLGVASAVVLGSFGWTMLLGLAMNMFWHKHKDGYDLFCMVLQMRNERDAAEAGAKMSLDAPKERQQYLWRTCPNGSCTMHQKCRYPGYCNADNGECPTNGPLKAQVSEKVAQDFDPCAPIFPTSDPTEAAKAYAAANPLGGPARVFEAMASRIRAGEDYYSVLDDFGFQPIDDSAEVLAEHDRGTEGREWHSQGAWLLPGDRIIVQRNADPQSGAAGAGTPVPDETGDAGVAPGQSPALPHSKTQAKRIAAQAGETPRVDACAFELDECPWDEGQFVPAGVARTLERELASANASLAFKSAQVDRIVVEEAAATKAAKERAKKLEFELASASKHCNETALERNALRDELAALKHDIERAVAENTRLLNENLAMEKDAERYRWLYQRYGVARLVNVEAQPIPCPDKLPGCCVAHFGPITKEMIDAAIDAARSKGAT